MVASSALINSKRKLPPWPSGHEREEQVDGILFASADVATVFLASRVGERRFKDLLSFVRAPDDWKIVAKTYAWVTPRLD